MLAAVRLTLPHPALIGLLCNPSLWVGVPHTHHTHVRVGIRVITIAMGTYAQLLNGRLYALLSLCRKSTLCTHTSHGTWNDRLISTAVASCVLSTCTGSLHHVQIFNSYLINWQLINSNFYQLASASLAERFTGLWYRTSSVHVWRVKAGTLSVN